MLFLNVIVLIMEVLYYSLFMKFARKEGKLWRYLLSFGIITFILSIIGTNHMYSYLFFGIMVLLCIKYIIKLKLQSFHMFIIIEMLLFKIIVEAIIVLILYNLMKMPIWIVLIFLSLIKLLLIILFKNKIYFINKYFYGKWINNNFYIRYIFTIFIFIYIIASCIAIIFY